MITELFGNSMATEIMLVVFIRILISILIFLIVAVVIIGKVNNENKD